MQSHGNCVIDLRQKKNTPDMATCAKHIQQIFFNLGRPPICQIHKVVYPFLAIISVACLPAHFFSCSRTVAPECVRKQTESRQFTVKMTVKDNGNRIRSCDVLIYNADKFGRLDSYTHFDGNPDEIQVSSGEGPKTAYVICNAPAGSLKTEDMLTERSLASICCELEQEDPEYPVLSGRAVFEAGGSCRIALEPLMAKVCLKELSCDFRGTAYPLEELKDVRVYLTNVNADCSMTGDGAAVNRFINNGQWEDGDALRFRSPQMLCREIDGSVGMDVRNLDLDLYCYPNAAEEESFGKPFTKLVIEGSLKGRRWFWPISINPIGNGIGRNSSIGLKVRLRRSGTDDPDAAISMDIEKLVMDIEQWEEKGNYAVVF